MRPPALGERLLLGAALVAAYYGAAHLGYAFEFAGPVAAIVWLPVGVAIAFLYFFGLSLWPAVVAGDLLVNNYTALPLGTALATSGGNLLEAVLATVILRRASRGGPLLETVPGAARVLVALAAGTAVSASIGSVASLAGGLLEGSSLDEAWRTWWLGDFSGGLLVVPLALAWWRPLPHGWERARSREAAVLLAVVLGIGWLVFENRVGRPLSYLAFPALVWASLRFGQRGGTLAVLVMSAFAVWGTTHQEGAFALQSQNGAVLSVQLFIVVTSVSALAVAALVSENEELAGRLRASRGRLVEAADAERRRLERNLHDGAQQRLVSLAGQLGVAREVAEDSPTELRELIEDAGSQAVLAIQELRELAHGIHPAGLRQFGFARAVATAVAGGGTEVELGGLPERRLDDTAEVTAYYVVLEGMANARKHAPGAPVRVSAEVRNGRLEVEVSDRGPGGARELPGFGIEGLRDRVEATGGSFTVTSPRGRGTRLAASIPARPTASPPSPSVSLGAQEPERPRSSRAWPLTRRRGT